LSFLIELSNRLILNLRIKATFGKKKLTRLTKETEPDKVSLKWLGIESSEES